jgi:hypothetical protein
MELSQVFLKGKEAYVTETLNGIYATRNKAAQKFPEPRNKKAEKCFLQVYRRFILEFKQRDLGRVDVREIVKIMLLRYPEDFEYACRVIEEFFEDRSDAGKPSRCTHEEGVLLGLFSALALEGFHHHFCEASQDFLSNRANQQNFERQIGLCLGSAVQNCHSHICKDIEPDLTAEVGRYLKNASVNVRGIRYETIKIMLDRLQVCIKDAQFDQTKIMPDFSEESLPPFFKVMEKVLFDGVCAQLSSMGRVVAVRDLLSKYPVQ